MKKILILTGALMTLIAGLAAAASSGIVNLSWNDCGAFGASNETFACNTNTGTHTLVGSFRSFVPLDSLNGNECVMEMWTSGPTMSPWWQIKTPTDNSPACRNTALTANFNFVNGPSNCFDYWAGRALGGVGIIRDQVQTNRARILVVCAVALEEAGPVAPSIETYSFNMVITNAKTVGTGACAGCTDGMVIILDSIKCTQNPGVTPTSAGDEINLSIDKSMETLGTHASFQAGVPTPTKNITWGAVKSLYR